MTDQEIRTNMEKMKEDIFLLKENNLSPTKEYIILKKIKDNNKMILNIYVIVSIILGLKIGELIAQLF